MRTPSSHSRLLVVAICAMALGVAFHAAHALLDFGGPGIASFAKNWVYTAVELLAVAVCGARTLRRRADRWVWGLITFALSTWTAGDLVWTLWLNNLANPPVPSVADALYLTMYPAMYAALMLLIRARLRHVSAAQWLDGGVVALTLAAVGTELVLPTVMAVSQGHLVQDAVNLAYPLGDLTLLAFVVLAFSLSGWRPDRLWLLLGLGMVMNAVADLLFVYQAAKGTYAAGGILDTMWPASMALFAVAAWQPAKRRAAPSAVAPHTIALPLIAFITALAMLVEAAFRHVTPAVVGLAAAALVVALVRGLLTFMENVRMLRDSAQDAVTDGLSGLGNRRRLVADLDRVVAIADSAHPRTLVFFDLNGFKHYNDTFGHAAGDVLLARLGASLRTAVGSQGRAYRLGGDEFCILLRGRFAKDDRIVAAATAALTDSRDGVTVSASRGLAIIPDDTRSSSSALQLADQRMYAAKIRTTRSLAPRTHDVLVQVLRERAPDPDGHRHLFGRLAAALGRDLELDEDHLAELLRAADLNDVGKLAIPEAVLDKPGPLDASEWELVRRHPVIGERILDVDPALRPAARLVRASHEHWDGGGYPDGLAGSEIPLGARIIAACDAFDAMTSNRPHRPARSVPDAVAELRRNAGTQFDPAVVDALCRRIAAEPVPADLATAGVPADLATAGVPADPVPTAR
jgi:two-component system cell cycle response regulator